MSAAFCDETWNPGTHYRVEPASDLNPVDLVNGSFWNLRDVVILARSFQSFRRGKDGRSTLDPPGEQHLGRGQRGLLGDGQNCRIFQRTRPYTMTQWRKCQKNNTRVLAELQQLRLRQIRMRFHLDHGRFDPRGLIERQPDSSTTMTSDNNPMARHLPESTRFSIARCRSQAE